jgi:type II secretory pathway predicted ATPase ExeA
MRLNEDQKREIESSVPPSAEVRKALEQYLDVTGMTPTEFADACDRSPNTIRYFLRDEYDTIAGSDLLVRQRVWNFMQSHPVTPETRGPGKLYPTEDYRLLRRYFYLAMNRRRAYVVQADPGIGKTFLSKHLISELNRREISNNGSGRRAFFVRAGEMSPVQLLKEIATACGISPVGDRRRVVRALRRAFVGRSVLIVIDEAQQLSIAALEAVRELLDEPPHCGLLVIGSHELERKFTVSAVELEQWNSRIFGFRALDGLSAAEARLILSEELPGLQGAAIRSILKDCTVSHLRKRATEYISARRLFAAIEDIKADNDEGDGGAA